MTKRFRRNHSPAFKAKVALAVMLSESRRCVHAAGPSLVPAFWIKRFGRTVVLNRDGSNLDWHRRSCTAWLLLTAEQGCSAFCPCT
jgi:hypothetical protein